MIRILFFSALLVLSGCASVNSNSRTTDGNIDSRLGPEAVLHLAENALETVNDSKIKSEVSVEVAKAQFALGQTEKAKKTLQTSSNGVDSIEGLKNKVSAMYAIAKGFADIGAKEETLALVDRTFDSLRKMEVTSSYWNTVGKLATTLATVEDFEKAFSVIDTMPDIGYAESAYKARTYKEIATLQAALGDFDGALSTLDKITMGITYYASTARAEVATYAINMGEKEIADKILAEALKIADEENENGYFKAGMLRYVAQTYGKTKNTSDLIKYLEETVVASKNAPDSAYEARALTRVASAWADFGYNERGLDLITEALKIAQNIEEDSAHNRALYEIAGAAAFASDFEAAMKIAENISNDPQGGAMSIKNATYRDIAWGMVRHDRLAEAIQLVKKINTPREQVQAYSRIVILMKNPKMNAAPRYR